MQHQYALQIHKNDQLSKMICGDCVYKLDLFFNFREKSLQTESFLINLIKKLSNPIINNKIEDSKMICNQPAIQVENTLGVQELHNLQSEELLNQATEMRLVHALTKRESMNVEEDIILNSQNIDINHPLENIELSSHELQTEDMASSIQDQELNLQHSTEIEDLVEEEINIHSSQLNVENLDLIHAQHNLIVNQFDSVEMKIKMNEEEKMTIAGLKNDKELVIKVSHKILNINYILN